MTTTINAENILRVADAIEGKLLPGVGFNMNYFVARAEPGDEFDKLKVSDCGTIACIAGWTHLLFKADGAYAKAGDALGLSEDQREELFFASNHPESEEGDFGPLEDIEPDQAVRTLRHLAATGEVSWEV